MENQKADTKGINHPTLMSCQINMTLSGGRLPSGLQHQCRVQASQSRLKLHVIYETYSRMCGSLLHLSVLFDFIVYNSSNSWSELPLMVIIVGS